MSFNYIKSDSWSTFWYFTDALMGLLRACEEVKQAN